MDKKIKFGFIGLVVVVVILFLGFFIQSQGLLSFDALTELIESTGIWAPIVFALFYIAITLIGISAAFFTVLAGTLFGTVNGLIIVVISATISATIAFFITRFLSKEFLSDKSSKKQSVVHGLIEKIDKQVEKNGFYAITILRLSFLPYIPLSYASGLVKKLKASDFILATFITNIFGSFVFIFLGDRIGELLKENFEVGTLLTLGIAIVLLVAFIIVVPKVANKLRGKEHE